MPKLAPEQVETELATLSGWALADGRLCKKYDFPTYPDAIAAIVRVGFAAEAADHHPDLSMNWKRVTFKLITHSAQGLTENDFALARTIDALLEGARE